MKAIEHYFFCDAICYAVQGQVLTCEAVDEIVKCEHSNIKLFSSTFLCVFDTLFKDKL